MILTDTQQVAVGPIAVTDKRGNPAAIDGVPAWASSDANVATVEASADGLSAVVKSAGPLGSAQVSVTVDADLGEGIVNLVGTVDFDVVSSQAVAVSVPAGTPEEQP